MGKIERVKRRLVVGAIEDNLETMRGFGPWTLERSRWRMRVWLRRAFMAILPLTLIASTILVPAVTGELPFQGKHPEATAANLTPMALASSAPRPVHPAITTPLPPAAEMRFTELPAAIDPSVIPLEVHRVVLDAGHGGSDPGTVAGELLEKEITLDINQRLEQMLKTAGFEVHMTRESDSTVALRNRAQIANSSGADIFVSIHVNSIRGSRAIRGIETYYLGATDDPILTELAASENRGSGYTLSDYRKLLEGIYADVRQDESRALARSIQGNLHIDLVSVNPYLENWGVRKAPFVVLVATEMPAILAEVGCLSNQEDTRLLATSEYRQRIADALFKGIVAYAQGRAGESQKGI